MSVTILEALQNADYNIRNNGGIGLIIAKEQLHNAVTLLEKGYSVGDEVEPLLEQYGEVESVPEKAGYHCIERTGNDDTHPVWCPNNSY